MNGNHKVLRALAAAVAGCACLIGTTRGAEMRPGTSPACSVDMAGMGPVHAGIPPDQSLAAAGASAKWGTGFTADGLAYFRLTAGDLDVMKSVTRSGELTIQLRRGDEDVLIGVGTDSVTLSRNGQSMRLDLNAAGEDEALAARGLLAGSRSIRAIRVLAADVTPAVERTPAGMALLFSDAVIGVLDGDPGAVHRLADRLARRRAAVRRARSELGCYEKWEAQVIRAWDDYESCLSVYPSISMWRDACGWRWLLWAEAAWFEFLKCVGSPFTQ